LVTLGVGAIVAWAVLASLVLQPQRDLEEFALGFETQSHFATVDGVPIHCSDLDEAQPCLDGHAARGGRPVALWLGNSQLHAINQLKDADRSAAEILHHSLDGAGIDVVAFSIPNANYQELLVYFGFLSKRLPVRSLIVPLVFDDFRELGLRGVASIALEDPDVVAFLEDSEAGRSILADRSQRDEGSLAALEGTVQERSESALDGWLSDHWELWSLRPKARGRLLTRLFVLRNTVFGITPQSKRPVIPGRLRLNFDAYAAMLDQARERDIEVVTYVVPLRNDVEVPYIASEYEAFRREAQRVAEEHGARFADFDDLVPGEYWGMKDSTTLGEGVELDFMHFQGAGHELLADAVERLLSAGGGPG
jgi:hypothetical protein